MHTKSLTNRQNTQHFAILQSKLASADHWKLVAESSEFHLTLKRAHRAHFFQPEIRKKKRDILSEKRESGMALKKREFIPESGTVDTYGIAFCGCTAQCGNGYPYYTNWTCPGGCLLTVCPPSASVLSCFPLLGLRSSRTSWHGHLRTLLPLASFPLGWGFAHILYDGHAHASGVCAVGWGW